MYIEDGIVDAKHVLYNLPGIVWYEFFAVSENRKSDFVQRYSAELDL